MRFSLDGQLGDQVHFFWLLVRYGSGLVPQHRRTSTALNAAWRERKDSSVKELLASGKGQPGPSVSFVSMKFSPGNVIRISQFKALGKSNYLWVILGADRRFCQKLDSWTV